MGVTAALKGQEMRDRQSVIVLEFNELTPSLMTRFIAEGWLPNFKKFYDQSLVFTTVAEEREPYLEPWIQWVTVHTGLNYEAHRLFHLNEGHALGRPRVWELLAEHSLRSWICGSMNVREPASPLCHVLPDPWCTKVDPRPGELKPFFSFVQRQVAEHTNDTAEVGRQDYLAFLRFMTSHGLSPSTVWQIGEQLVSERFKNERWKRVVLLDRLQFDVFRHFFAKWQPHFSTLFLNSTAHYQHAYWDSMEPESFTNRPSDETREQFETAIRFGYEQMDKLLGRITDVVGANATVILCTALSQQPAADAAQVFYRPHQVDRLTALVGIESPYRATPVMTQQFYLEFESESIAARAQRQLLALTMNGREVMECRLEGNRIFAGCAIPDAVADGAMLEIGERRVPFYEMFYRMETGKTGIHHPYGLFWVRTPGQRHRVEERHVPLTAVAPTILSLFDVEAPSYMTAPVDLGLPSRRDERPVAAGIA